MRLYIPQGETFDTDFPDHLEVAYKDTNHVIPLQISYLPPLSDINTHIREFRPAPQATPDQLQAAPQVRLSPSEDLSKRSEMMHSYMDQLVEAFGSRDTAEQVIRYLLTGNQETLSEDVLLAVNSANPSLLHHIVYEMTGNKLANTPPKAQKEFEDSLNEADIKLNKEVGVKLLQALTKAQNKIRENISFNECKTLYTKNLNQLFDRIKTEKNIIPENEAKYLEDIPRIHFRDLRQDLIFPNRKSRQDRWGNLILDQYWWLKTPNWNDIVRPDYLEKFTEWWSRNSKFLVEFTWLDRDIRDTNLPELILTDNKGKKIYIPLPPFVLMEDIQKQLPYVYKRDGSSPGSFIIKGYKSEIKPEEGNINVLTTLRWAEETTLDGKYRRLNPEFIPDFE